MENSIEVRNITKLYKLYDKPSDKVKEAFSFGKKRHKSFYALNDISFDVKKGETFGIIGTNGSGKSTLLKIITGVVKANSGSITVNGKVSALLELGAGFNPDYTGIENVYLNGMTMGYSRKEMDQKMPEILAFADIGDFINQPVKNYSSGMFARLAFAVAINVEPEVLIVDEALSVGDVFFQNKCFKKFEELRSKGITILFVSHDLSSIKQMCTRVLWIEHGIQMMCSDSLEVCNSYSNSINRKSFTVDKGGSDEYNIMKMSWNHYPQVSFAHESKLSDDVVILSAVFEDENHCIVTELEPNKMYTFVQIFRSNRNIEKCISGFVLETLKGLWIINSNTAINGKKMPYSVKENSINRVDFTFRMPSIIKGEYIIGTAVSEGEIEDFNVLTWLYRIMKVDVINNHGANSALVDIFPDINIYNRDENK